MKTKISVPTSLAFLLVALIVLGGFGLQNAHTSSQPSRAFSPLKAKKSPYILLQEARELAPVYTEPSVANGTFQVASAGGASLSENARPLALASADLDLDGFPDLVCGYASPSGGVLTLHRSNREAFAPTDPAVLKGIAKGKSPSPFLSKALIFSLPEAPDFIATGDFNRDGNPDVMVAARASGTLYLLAGDRQGGFASTERVNLPGTVTAMMAGDINQRDGLTDLVVGVNSADSGPALLVYDATESLLVATPSVHPLPAEARSLAAGDLDDDRSGDIAVVSGNRVLVLHGRDQRVGVDGSPAEERPRQFETLNLANDVTAIALGEFIPDRNGRTEMAVMSQDGRVHIAARGTLDTRPMTVEEMRIARRKMANERKEVDRAIERGVPVTTAPSSTTGSSEWNLVEDLQIEGSGSVATASTGAPQPTFVSTRMSGLPSDDLLIMNASGRSVQVILGKDRRQNDSQVSVQSVERSVVEVDSGSETVAALPMRLNVNGKPGLVVLRKGAKAPSFFTPQANSTFIVTTSLDTDDLTLADGLCLDSAGGCSLRAAVQQANNDLINDTIMFAPTLNGIPIKLVQPGNDGNAAGGDLDINGNLTIIGNGAANTIIQGSNDATFSGSNGEKIFGINQDGIYDSLTVSISEMTIRYARNTVPFGDPSFAYTGGGVDVFLTGLSNSVTFTNCTIDNNANASGYGGGVNVDSFTFGSNAGTVSFTGCIISNNKLQSVPTQNGAGVNLFADNHNVSFTNCTVTGNQAQNTSFGGGINIRHSNGGTVTINNTNVTNNTAGSNSGGIQTGFSQTVNMNVGNITGNSANGDGGGFNSSGGINNLSNLTISNNSASSGGGLFVSGGTLNVSLSRIAGNTAVIGTGIRQIGGAAIVENNWWGCDGFPNAVGCQSGVGLFDADPRIDLRLLPTSATVPPGGTQTFTADVSQNTNGTTINPFVLNGLTITFANTPGLGSVSPTSAPLTGLTASTTFTATSPCPTSSTGNVSATLDNGTQTSAVTIQAPIVLSACPANQTVNADAGQCSASVSFTAPTATGCPTPTVTCRIGATTITSPHAFPIGTSTVTCTASNGGVSLDQSCSFTVTVNDAQPPTVTCPSPISANTAPGLCSAVVTYTTPTGSDNCPGVTVACVPASGSTFNKGVTTVTCTATDAAGLTGNCTFTVTVNDNQQPTIGACPAPITTNTTSGQCSAVVTYTSPTSSDNCPGQTVACSPPSGATFPKGTTTVTCTATDTTGNTANCTFTVTVNDNQPPSITCPSNINTTENPPGSGCRTVTYTTPTPSDNCPGATASCSPPSGTCFPIGSTTVTCTATDASGNTANCTFSVNVSVACTITCPANITTGNSAGQCGAVVNYPAPGASPGCGAVTCSPSSGSFFPVGTTTVTCSTTAGPSCSFTVRVNDTQGPQITFTGPITLSPPNHQYVPLTMSQLVTGASDNCDAGVDINDVVITKVTSDEPENGGGDGNTINDIVIAANCKSVQLRSERKGNGNGRVYTIWFRVVDASGNVSNASRTVTVQHNTGNPAVDDGPASGYTVISACGP